MNTIFIAIITIITIIIITLIAIIPIATITIAILTTLEVVSARWWKAKRPTTPALIPPKGGSPLRASKVYTDCTD